jgi:hypothetical protein
MSLRLKVFDASKSIYQEFKDYFLAKVKGITEKISKMSKEIKEDKSSLDNSMQFSSSGLIEVDDKETLVKK